MRGPARTGAIASLVIASSIASGACQHPSLPRSTPPTFVSTLDPVSLARAHGASVALIETPHRIGAAFVVRANGVFVTSLHVIAGERQARVVLQDGTNLAVKRVLATDEGRDLAIVAVDASDLVPVTLDPSERGDVGERVVVIGAHPDMRAPVVVDGLVSTKERTEAGGFLEITAPRLPGSTGAPVFDGDGRVVGMMVAASSVDDALAVVVPAREIARLLDGLHGTSGETIAAFGDRTRRRSAGGRSLSSGIDERDLEACSVPSRDRVWGELQLAIHLARPVYDDGADEAAYRLLESATLRLASELSDCKALLDVLETAMMHARDRSTPGEAALAIADVYELVLDLVFSGGVRPIPDRRAEPGWRTLSTARGGL